LESTCRISVKITADATQLTKGLQDAEKQTASFADSFVNHSKAIGAAMTAAGTVITGALGVMTKAALDEDINIKHLAITLQM